MTGRSVVAFGQVGRWIETAPMLALVPLVVGLGSLAALGQAPYNFPIFFIAAAACAMGIWRVQPAPRRAAWVGWAFGSGYFALALVWIVEPFQVDVERHGWMAPFALFFLSAGLALFWAFAFWSAHRWGRSVLGLAGFWAFAEVLRAYIFTGFPWASPAQILIDGPAAVLLSLGGPHLGTWVLLLVSGGLIAFGARFRLAKAAVLVGAVFALHGDLSSGPAMLTDKWVRLIQPNAAQHLKWQPELAEVFFSRQLEYTQASPAAGHQRPELIVWPETAIPWRLETAQPILTEITRAAGGRPVALGALRLAPDGLRNSLAVLGADGVPQDIYDKHHLVPFGEYIPFAKLADRFGLAGLASSGIGFSKGDGPRLLELGPLGRALPLICYEAVFAHGVNKTQERPDFLLQVTNDAWFGEYAGPQQHLAQARMRAIEQGLPLMRAANTGISAMIDPRGRVLAQLPLNTSGFLDTPLPAPAEETFYRKSGDSFPVGLILLSAIVAIVFRGRSPIGINN